MENSHFCLRCGSILVGLENYINHRRFPCDNVSSKITFDESVPCDVSKMDIDVVKMEVEDRNFEPDKAAEKVEADNFFSSLELQSSSKTSNNSSGINVQGTLNKAISGIVTRSKRMLSSFQECKYVQKPETEVRPKSRKGKRKTQKKIRKTKKKKSPAQRKKAPQRRTSVSVPKEGDDTGGTPGPDRSKKYDEWVIPVNSAIKTEEREGSDSIRRYTPELYSLSPVMEIPEDKEVEEENKFMGQEQYEHNTSYIDSEEVDEYAPPRSHTGGKWKPGSLPVKGLPILWPNQTWDNLQDEEGRNSSAESPTESDKNRTPVTFPTGGKWKSYNPPSTYTGGKWKPSESPQSIKKEQDVPPATYTGGKWYPGKRSAAEPPATHTGGKWKPQITSTHQAKSEISPDPDWVRSSGKTSINNKALDVIASYESTSGKCLKTAGGLIHYYCSPCNRRLASKKIYKKHIMSELHLKRLLQENELDFDSRSVKLVRGYFSVMKNHQRGAGKREVKKPQFFQVELGSVKRSKENDKCDKIKLIRMPRSDLIRCNVCKAKLASHQLGKHLVSYYHSRRINLDDTEQQKLVLDNIHSIIKHSPFQCGICKYYFNSHSLFKKHWMSEEHKSKEDTTGRKFWCVLCNFECDTSLLMEQHLDSDSHLEVIMAVNKSIPIIIRQKQILMCTFCDKVFRYNIALIRHNRILHGIKEIPEVHPCENCDFKSSTVRSLQAHTLHCHRDTGKVPYYCSACGINFDTAEDARNHRKSQAHKIKAAKDTKARTCSYCSSELTDVEKLKVHIDEVHTDLRPKCSKCGRTFTLPQEIAQHKCSFLQVQSGKVEKYGCTRCAYSSSIKADVLYHETLHDKKREDLQNLVCPVCGNIYRMFALKIHLRTHTGERPYKCQPCSKTFVRKTRLVAHLKLEHKLESKEEGPRETPKRKRTGTKSAERLVRVRPRRKHYDRTMDLERSTLISGSEMGYLVTGKEKRPKLPNCADARCRYSSKDPEDMKYHLQVHKARNVFQCQLCDYKSKTYTILRRHNKTHFDEKLYQCPHCNFSGRLPAHLKRHMRLHTGAKPYKCPHCHYRCNNLENLRKHVMQTRIHPGKKLYDCKLCDFSTNAFQSFKKHVFDKHSDSLGSEAAATAYISGVYKEEEDICGEETATAVQSKTMPATLKTYRPAARQIVIAKKLEPGDPRPRKYLLPRLLGNPVEDGKTAPDAELARSQVGERPAVRSYPSASMLKARKELRLKAGRDAESAAAGKLAKASAEGDSAKESGPRVKVVVNEMDTQADNTLPPYVVYESGIPFDDNEEHLAEKEFYLFENLND